MGSNCHRFRLAAKCIVEERKELVERIQALLKKLSYSFPLDLRRQLTPLSAKQANSTRWSSTYEMICRYVAHRPFLPGVIHVDVAELLLEADKDADVYVF